jgi:hypothetical protein
MNTCIFENYPTKPNKEGVLCFSLFFREFSKKKYIYLDHLNQTVEKLDSTFPGWKIRIFYDDSVDNDKKYTNFITQCKSNKNVQLVKFYCDAYRNPNGKGHLNLFGTITRFYSLFDGLDETVLIRDTDIIITKTDYDITQKFIKSDYDLHIYAHSYKIVRQYYYDNKYPEHMVASLLSSKIKFPIKYWNEMLNWDTSNDEEIKKIVSKLSTDRKVNYHKFEYGMDEILLNYYLKKILKTYNYSMLVTYCIADMPYSVYCYLKMILNNFKQINNDHKKMELLKLFIQKVSKNSIDTDNLYNATYKLMNEIFKNINTFTIHKSELDILKLITIKTYRQLLKYFDIRFKIDTNEIDNYHLVYWSDLEPFFEID